MSEFFEYYFGLLRNRNREIIDVEYEDVSDTKELPCNLQIEEIEAEEIN